jgi:putative oxidoreductase
MQRLTGLYQKFTALTDQAQPVILLGLRLWMAYIFWKSGLTKIEDWNTTLFLFADEYQVPILPPVMAAFFATAFELICPVLLCFGFLTRAATLPLLAMTAVIQFTYLQHTDHLYWAMLLGTILTSGPGKLSLDYFLGRQHS